MKIDWIKIKNYYITRSVSLEEIAKKFKVSMSAVKMHCREEGWVKEKENKKSEIDQTVNQKMTEKEVNRKVAENERHIELYDNGLKIVEGILRLYMQKLEISDVNRVKVSPDALEKVFSCIEKAQKGQRLALNIGADDSEEKKDDEIKIIEGLNEDKI